MPKYAVGQPQPEHPVAEVAVPLEVERPGVGAGPEQQQLAVLGVPPDPLQRVVTGRCQESDGGERPAVAGALEALQQSAAAGGRLDHCLGL